MATDILIRFLDAGLINVGGDDVKLGKLKETSTYLADSLKKTPSKAASFALIAFDPVSPVDDLVIKEVIQALQKSWPTYVNTFSGTPVGVFRAILLDALIQASADDEKVGVAFITSERNVLPFMEADNERTIWIDVINEIEARVEARAESEWTTPSEISFPAMSFATPSTVEVKTSPITIKRDVLAQQIEATVGPISQDGQPTGGTAQWPNSGQVWAFQFSARITDVLAGVLTSIGKGPAIAPLDLSGPLNGLAQAVSTHVTNAIHSVAGATAGLQRRTNLIWWKEALYSPSAKASYRGMPESIAAALMAFDLYQQLPIFSPASVAAFLQETVLSLSSSEDTGKRPINELLNEAINSTELAQLRKNAARLIPDPSGRGPVLGLLGHRAGQPALDQKAFRDRIGVPADTMLTPPEWATWLFRELQAARATEEGTEPKKRTRKSG